METPKIIFTLTQSEIIGNIQDRIYIELCRKKDLFEEKDSYFIQLKTLSSNNIYTEKFSLAESEKISNAILYIAQNEPTFPTKGNASICFQLDTRLKIEINRKNNGWEFILKSSKVTYKIQWSELLKLQELIFAAINSANLKSEF